MQVICLQEDAYFEILKKSYEYIKTLHNVKEEKWISPEQAMDMLGVKTTKLQELRDNNDIQISKPSKKVILYNIDSIREYLEKHARKG